MKNTSKDVYAKCFVFVVLALIQTNTMAQWVDKNKNDYYKSQQDRMQSLMNSLSILEKSNPKTDFRKSVSRGDTRFIGVIGAGLFFPNLSSGSSTFAYTHGFKTLKGSTDFATPEIDNRLNKVIASYVVVYNKLMLRYLLKKKRVK